MVYGIGTRSYNRSTEHREMKRQQAEATAKFLAKPRAEVIAPLVCHCRSFEFPHGLEKHRELRSDWDWRTPGERREIRFQEFPR